MSSYITIDLLNEINNSVVSILKTAFNTMDVMVQSGTSAIHIDPIPPDTTGTDINLPLFGVSAVQQYSYSQYDAIQDKSSSALSAYPGPNLMMWVNENGTSALSGVTGVSTNQCLVYAMSNGIIKQLINDHKLITNTNISTSAINWLLQTNNIDVTFNEVDNYPYYQTGYTLNVGSPIYTTYDVSDVGGNTVIGNVTIIDNNYSLNTVQLKVTKPGGGFLQLEKSVAIAIDPKILSENYILGCNILVYSDALYYNTSDWQIDRVNNNIIVKFKTDFSYGDTTKNYDIFIQYFYI